MFDNSKIFGYARVSTKDQNLERQFLDLKQYVTSDRDIFFDKASDKNFDRPGYQTLKMMIRPGDTVYVCELDRLGRNKKEIKEELEFFKENKVKIRILNIPTTLTNFDSFDSKLELQVMDMVNNILIEVLSTIAETERENIIKRQQEGIEAAKQRGVKFGRPVKNLPPCWEEDKKKLEAKEVTAIDLMKKYNMASSTFYTKLKEEKQLFISA